jgi:ATP-dependent HslUV protease ATP-binding subunit HslU
VREAASEAAMERLLTALVGDNASEATRESFRERIVQNAMNDVEVEIDIADTGNGMPFDMGNMGGNMQMIDLSDMMGKAFGRAKTKKQKMRVPEAWDKLVDEEADKRLDDEDVSRTALQNAETNGIVFLDEIDKIAVSDVRGGSVSREGVQRDLLPLIEGTTVATKYGPMKTDHVLFIASGAFHVAKPSDMLPELQGRLPIRVNLRALTQEDFVRILSETRANLVEQYSALLGTEKVELDITKDAVQAVATIAAQVNESIENIGARRLQTVMEKLLEEISFEAEDHEGETVKIDAAYVQERLGELAGDSDLSKYIL